MYYLIKIRDKEKPKMTRTEIARFIKKKYKEFRLIKMATVDEIARALDITPNELKLMSMEYLKGNGYTISKTEREAIMRNVNKSYLAYKEFPIYKYKHNGEVILESRTRYDYIVLSGYENMRFRYRGCNENKAKNTDGEMITFTRENRIEKMPTRFEGFAGFAI